MKRRTFLKGVAAVVPAAIAVPAVVLAAPDPQVMTLDKVAEASRIMEAHGVPADTVVFKRPVPHIERTAPYKSVDEAFSQDDLDSLLGPVAKKLVADLERDFAKFMARSLL